MTRNQYRNSVAAASVKNRTVSRATSGEVMALTVMSGLAFVSMAIGGWSVLAFAGALAGEGPLGMLNGLVTALTGV